MLNDAMELFKEFMEQHPNYQMENYKWGIVRGKNKQAVVFYHQYYPGIDKLLEKYNHTSAFSFFSIFEFSNESPTRIFCRKNIYNSGKFIEKEFLDYLYRLKQAEKLSLHALSFYKKIRLRTLLSS